VGVGVVLGATPGIPVNDGTGLGTNGAGTTGMNVVVEFCAPPPAQAAIAADAASATMAERYLTATDYAERVKNF
jgi:hypothetical protein